MNLLTFLHQGEERIGFVQDGNVIDLREASPRLGRLASYTSSMRALLEGGDGVLRELSSRVPTLLHDGAVTKSSLKRLSSAKLLAPVPRPGKIICAGINYHSHTKESGASATEPYFFFKPSTAVVGSGDEVSIPSFSKQPDHEVELGVVMGREGKDIPASRPTTTLQGTRW